MNSEYELNNLTLSIRVILVYDNMIQIEFGPSTILGMGLVIVGVFLYMIRTKHPGLSRDYDLFFSSVGLLCGSILMFQGWRLDPILLLCQLLSSGTAIFFVAESLWLRNNNIQQKQINHILQLDMNNTIFETNQTEDNLSVNQDLLLNYKFSKLFHANTVELVSQHNLINYTLPIDYDSELNKLQLEIKFKSHHQNDRT